MLVTVLKTIVSADGQRSLTIYQRVEDGGFGVCEDMRVRDFNGNLCWTAAYPSELERMVFSHADLAESEARARIGWTSEISD